MVLMAKRHHLTPGNIGVRSIGGPEHRIDHPYQEKEEAGRPQNRGSRQSITAASKNLRHTMLPAIPSRRKPSIYSLHPSSVKVGKPLIKHCGDWLDGCAAIAPPWEPQERVLDNISQ